MRHRTRVQTALTVMLVAASAASAGCGSGEPTVSTGGGASDADAIIAPADEDDAPGGSTSTTAETSEAAVDESATGAESEAEDDGDSGAQSEGSTSAEPDAAVVAADADTPGVIDVSLTDAERTAADDPIAQAIISAFPPGFAPPSPEQANCVGGKIVNEVGTDRLAELGITADSIDVFGATDFTAGEVDAMVDILFECVDVETMVASMFAPSAGPETADCFADFVDEQLIRDLAAPFLGGGAIDAEFFLEQVQAANAVCLTAEG